MAAIVLTTLNARYSHASFGLRYLLANMGELQAQTRLMEYDLRVEVENAADQICAEQPRIIGIGVYIWNSEKCLELVKALRKRLPHAILVLGGPEVSHEVDQQELCALAQYIITDEGDLAWPRLCRQLLQGDRPPGPIIPGGFVDVNQLALPYHLYTDRDIAERVIYVEASRGCPFTCEFCLSSLNVPVRRFPLETLLPEFATLLDRGVRHFKFVDRTFNLSIKYSLRILDFFLQNYREGLFLHFEMIPDRLPDELADLLIKFPRGMLQFEVGIQTFNEDVADRIRRRQDFNATEKNLRWLLRHTGSYLHADLIMGLPGESLESFGRGFDRLVAIAPQEIQVNLLKRLRGTPIVRHDAAFGMKYNPQPPYELLENRDLDNATVMRLQRFSRYWNLFVNSGNFITSAPLIWAGGQPFDRFLAFSDELHARFGRAHALALEQLAEALFDHVCGKNSMPPAEVAAHLWRDISSGGRRDMPPFLRAHLPGEPIRAAGLSPARTLARQARRNRTA
jgi:radical SAM superfamily enzyme YgiQ (UPF0313 family)